MAKEKWVELDIKFDDSNIKALHKAVKAGGQKAIDRAVQRAAKAGASTFTSGSKGGAPNIYTIKGSELKEMTRVRDGTITVKSKLLSIGQSPAHFTITPKEYISQKGIPVRKRRISTATIKKGNKKRLRSAFIANPAAINGGTTMLWERSGKGKTIKPVKTLSAPQMIENPEVEDNVMKSINETLSKRLDHELKRMGL